MAGKKKRTMRVDLIQVTAFVTTFDAGGAIVDGPHPAKPVTFYRKTTPDVWVQIDRMLRNAQAPAGSLGGDGQSAAAAKKKAAPPNRRRRKP